MITFEGKYMDGKSAKVHPVTLFLDNKTLRIKDTSGTISFSVPLQECTIQPPIGKSNRIIQFPDEGLCETNNFDAVKALEQTDKKMRAMNLIHFLERQWKIVFGCLMGILLASWGGVTYGIPFAAEKMAYSVPKYIAENVSTQALLFFDDKLMVKTELDEKRQSEIKALLQTLIHQKTSTFNYRLEFRKSPTIGPNAFALPSGIIIITDELITLAENDLHLTGVLVHEMAHVENRHGFRLLFQNAGLLILLSALTGDIASITSTLAALPALLAESGYSRDFELEADTVAASYFIQQGVSTKPYQDMLLRISKDATELPGTSIFSTHPETLDRVKYVNSLENGQ